LRTAQEAIVEGTLTVDDLAMVRGLVETLASKNQTNQE
jgi:hypothetical protein